MSTSNSNRHTLLPFNRADMPELLPIKKAASIIGVQYRQLLQCVHDGVVPHYKIGNSRQLVSVPEVIAIMKNDGGNDE